MSDIKDLKVAILGRGLTTLSGAAKHWLEIATAIGADMITLEDSDPNVLKIFERDVKIKSLRKKIPKKIPFSSISAINSFKSIDLRDEYDFFMGGGLSIYALKKHFPHLAYLFTPPRELYDLYYIELENQKTHFQRMLVSTWFDMYKYYDRNFVKKYVGNIICNSHNVRNRIFKVYQKHADVVYPPINTEIYSYRSSEGYWLSVNRLHPWKRVELQITAFRKLPDKKLTIVGETSDIKYKNKLLSMAPNNVEFLGNISEERLRDLYSRCEGHITTAIDEDFGMTPIEAMASGKPVVAIKEGGYLETVIDGVTGKLVSPHPNDVAKGVREISQNPGNYKVACKHRAKLFDFKVFENTLRKQILDAYVDPPQKKH